MKKIKYSTEDYPFKSLFETKYNLGLLEEIKEIVELHERKDDQKSKWHPLFYEWARTNDFEDLYKKFLVENIKPLYEDTKIVYQKIPTFRVALRENIAVGEFHKDKDYRNLDWAMKVREDNFYLPFTDAFDTNTIWVESSEDKGDYMPMNCMYGECIQWDGSNLKHGNKVNKTGKVRVSIDFRVMPFSSYTPSDKGSINMNTQFAIGGYYEVI